MDALKKEQQLRARRELIVAHQRADRVFNSAGITAARRSYDADAQAVVRSLSRVLKGSELTPDMVARARNVLARHDIAIGVNEALENSIFGTLRAGARSVGTFIAKVIGGRTPVDSVMEQAIERGRAAQLRIARAASAQAIRQRIAGDASVTLRAGLFQRAEPGEVLESIEGTLGSGWSWVQRTIRTETSYAYNRAQADAVDMVAKDPAFAGGVFMRWTELVDDATGKPLDNRVAPDSIVMHGQVAPPGGLFTMPDARGAGKTAGMSWAHPPNRPNDRSVLTPWMPGWGVPGWRLVGGTRKRL